MLDTMKKVTILSWGRRRAFNIYKIFLGIILGIQIKKIPNKMPFK